MVKKSTGNTKFWLLGLIPVLALIFYYLKRKKQDSNQISLTPITGGIKTTTPIRTGSVYVEPSIKVSNGETPPLNWPIAPPKNNPETTPTTWEPPANGNVIRTHENVPPLPTTANYSIAYQSIGEIPKDILDEVYQRELPQNYQQMPEAMLNHLILKIANSIRIRRNRTDFI